jgi:dihydroflavonol-4-reductase
MIEKVRSRRVVPYFSGGFSAVFVQDVAQGLVAALHHGEKGQRYLLGGENITYRALAERAAGAMDLRRCFVRIGPLLTGTAALLFETGRRCGLRQPSFSFVTHFYGSSFLFYDSSKARRVLSYAPRDFNAILEDALRFLRARPAGAAPGARGV